MRSSLKHSLRPWSIAGLVISLLFLCQWFWLFNPAQAVWDGGFYYAYARSIVFDQDLAIANDFVLSYPTAPERIVNKKFHEQLTETGRVESNFPIGPGVLWTPWLAVIRGLLPAFDTEIDSTDAVTGYEPLIVANIATLSSLLGLIAYGISFRISWQEVGWSSALWATVTLMFATPLIYYQFREPFYSHTSSAFIIAVIILLWYQQYQNPRASYLTFALGLAIGFAFHVRWQHAVYVFLPAASAVYWWVAQPASERFSRIRQPASYLLTAAAGTVFVVALQFVIWWLFYGTWVTIPQGESFMDWRAPFIFPVVLSTYRGLLPWMPAFFVSVVGFFFLGRKNRQLVVPLVVILILELYINGSSRDWFGGGGYGPRRFTSELIIFVIGYAGAIAALPERGRNWIAGMLASLWGLHQWLLLRYGLADKIGGQHTSMYPTFNWEEVTYSTFLAQLGDRLAHLWSFPSDLFMFPNSPAQLILNQPERVWTSFFALFQTGLFLAILAAVIVLFRRSFSPINRYRIGTVVAVTLIAWAYIWLFTWA